MVFENNNVEILNYYGVALFNPYHVGVCLGLKDSAVKMAITKMNNKQVIKLTNSKVKDIDFRKIHNTGENFLTKSGIYKLVFKSHKPEAERFQDWVTDDILPQIEQTGGYIPVEEEDDEKTIMAKGYVVAMKTVKQKDEIIQQKETVIKQLEPKAKEYDAFMNSQGNYSVNQVSNMLGFGEYIFFALLRDNKILRYENNDNVPFGRFRKSGHFIERATVDPQGHNHTKTYVTPKGLSYLCKKFNLQVIDRTVA